MEASHATIDSIGIAWRLFATLFFVFLNGFFVAAEFALVKARSSRIDALAKEGSRSARSVQHILKHLDQYLSACQLGITLASLILGALGEPAVSVLLIAAARGMGFELDPESRWISILAIGLAFTLITMLHMTVGEQAPKMWALRRSEGTAVQTAFVLRVFSAVFHPFIVVINGVSNAMLRLVGLPTDAGHESSHTAEEIRSILSLSARAGHITERESQLTANVFRMIELEVRHIVVPRVDVAFLSLERSDEENLATVRQSRHSRLPLCEVGLDTILGFVHAKEVLESLLAGTPVDFKSLARQPILVPDTMPVSNFLLELQNRRAHCAAVVDEHGTVIGLAFREDALEEIVGPLGDEFDSAERMFQVLPEGVIEVAGRMSLPELCDRCQLELPDDEYEDEDTIGGHVTARLGRMPERGDRVRFGTYWATVIDVSRRRVQWVRLEPYVEAEGDASEAAGA